MFPEGRALEFLIVAIVALVVVGPKDLPVLLRRLGQFMAKLRGMAAEFRASFDEMARQSELDELRKEVEALRRSQVADSAALAAGHADIHQTLDEIHQGLADAGAQLHPPMSYQYVEAPSEPLPAVETAPKPRRVAKPKAASASAPAKSPTRKTAAKPRARSDKTGGAEP